MPTITRALIKTAMGFALAGTLLSAIWLFHLAWPLHPFVAHFQPTAIHLIVVGWLTQLIIGVALWMFPIWSKAQPRGPEYINWLCYALLNTGLLLRLLAEPLNSYRPHVIFSWLLVVSAVMQVIAFWLFVAMVWTRVRPKPGVR